MAGDVIMGLKAVVPFREQESGRCEAQTKIKEPPGTTAMKGRDP